MQAEITLDMLGAGANVCTVLWKASRSTLSLLPLVV